MKYTDNDIIDLIESICDVLEENTPEANVEERNKKFLEADKKANKLTRLYRKAGEKFDKLVSQVTPDKEALRQARDTEEKLMQKMSDAHVIADKENKAQQDLKKQGVKGLISRETISIPRGEGYRYVKVLKTNEAFKLIEEAFGLMTSLCEVDSPDAIEDTSKEHNYLKREIKNKDGSKTDVVAVEDELFPYAGNAKQQFNQKVIAKINDMIEGRATLEDLIQFISAKNKVKKVHEDAELQRAFDIINDYINEKKYSKEELSKIAVKVIPSRKEAFDKACKVFDEILGNISASNIAVQNLTPIQQAEVNVSADEVERTQDRLNHATDVAGVPE